MTNTGMLIKDLYYRHDANIHTLQTIRQYAFMDILTIQKCSCMYMY